MYYKSTGKFDLNAYQFYIAHTDKHKYILKSIRDAVREKKAPWTVQLKDICSPFRFLDVGSGPGQLTIPILKLLLKERGMTNSPHKKNPGSNIIVHCLEPCEEGMDLLVKKLEKEGLNERINIKFIKKKVETWLIENSANGSIPTFDFILCSHTLYYIEGWSNLIDGLKNSLKEGGQLSIILASKETALYSLREKLIPGLESMPLVNLRFGEDVEYVLKNMNMRYEMEVKKSRVTFSWEETKAFFLDSPEKVDPVSEVLGFLFGYDPSALKEKKIFPGIKEFITSRTRVNGLILPYKDKIFWTTKNEL